MSLLKAIKAQLGLSSTATQNFTLTAEAQDGTMKLARGNAGATTQDILTVDVNGKTSFPQGGLQFPKAWANFDGTLTGTNAPRAGLNVTSITRLSTGLYRITFTNALADTNYTVQVTSGVSGSASCAYVYVAGTRSTTQVEVACVVPSTTVAVDAVQMNIVIFGN